jgi:hypothetical protein
MAKREARPAITLLFLVRNSCYVGKLPSGTSWIHARDWIILVFLQAHAAKRALWYSSWIHPDLHR